MPNGGMRDEETRTGLVMTPKDLGILKMRNLIALCNHCHQSLFHHGGPLDA